VLSTGGVRGFAFVLGLTTVLDLVIVVLFTHPLLQTLVRSRFFGKGHPLSGLDPALLGRQVPAYAGRGRLRPAAERGPRSAAERDAADAAVVDTDEQSRRPRPPPGPPTICPTAAAPPRPSPDAASGTCSAWCSSCCWSRSPWCAGRTSASSSPEDRSSRSPASPTPSRPPPARWCAIISRRTN